MLGGRSLSALRRLFPAHCIPRRWALPLPELAHLLALWLFLKEKFWGTSQNLPGTPKAPYFTFPCSCPTWVAGMTGDKPTSTSCHDLKAIVAFRFIPSVRHSVGWDNSMQTVFTVTVPLPCPGSLPVFLSFAFLKTWERPHEHSPSGTGRFSHVHRPTAQST